MKKVYGSIVNTGMGGFLNPPTHPEHFYSVETDLNRSPENRGSMSLSYALECDYLDDTTKERVRATLAQYVPQPIDSPEMQDWVHSVLGYFRNCYRNSNFPEPACWYAGNVIITDSPEEKYGLHPIDDHAGAHLIRKFYPDFIPTQANLRDAYWGKKVEKGV